MKKVVLIGKLNEVTKQINDALSSYCHIQLCADDVDIAGEMLRMVGPQLVIVSLIGSRTSHDRLFALLSREAHDTPILAVGTKGDEELLTEGGFLSENVRFLRRPVKLEQIAGSAKEMLGIEEGACGKAGVVLLVDDDPLMLRVVQSMIADRYRVTFATSGPKAISAIDKCRPDLILLDYDMPVVDGKQIFEMLRSEEDTTDIPIIFLTGMADAAHVQQVLALHPEGYLLKPPAKELLLEKIEKALAQSRTVGDTGDD